MRGRGREKEGGGCRDKRGEKRVRTERTCFDDLAARLEIEPGDDEGDIGEVEDLGPVWEGEGPKFGGGAEEVNEALAVARADLRAVRHADEVRVPVHAKAHVQLLASLYDERLYEIAGLSNVKQRKGLSLRNVHGM